MTNKTGNHQSKVEEEAGNRTLQNSHTMNMDENNEVSAVKHANQSTNLLATDYDYFEGTQKSKITLEHSSPSKKPKMEGWELTQADFNEYLKLINESVPDEILQSKMALMNDQRKKVLQRMVESRKTTSKPDSGNPDVIKGVTFSHELEGTPSLMEIPQGVDETGWMEKWVSNTSKPDPSTTSIDTSYGDFKLEDQESINELMEILSKVHDCDEILSTPPNKKTTSPVSTEATQGSADLIETDLLEIRLPAGQDDWDEKTTPLDIINESTVNSASNASAQAVTTGSEQVDDVGKDKTDEKDSNDDKDDTSNEPNDLTETAIKPNKRKYHPIRWSELHNHASAEYKQQFLSELKLKDLINSDQFEDYYRRIGPESMIATVVETKDFGLENIISQGKKSRDRQDLYMSIEEENLPKSEWIRKRSMIHVQAFKQGFKSVQPIAATDLPSLMAPNYRTKVKKLHWDSDVFSIGKSQPYVSEHFMKMFWKTGHDASQDIKYVIPQLTSNNPFMWVLDGKVIKYMEPDYDLCDEVDERLYNHIQAELYRNEDLYGEDRSEICTHYDQQWDDSMCLQPQKFIDKLRAIKAHNEEYNTELRSKPAKGKESSVGDVVLTNTGLNTSWGIGYRSSRFSSGWFREEPSCPINIIVTGNGQNTTPEDDQQEPKQGRSCTEVNSIALGQPISSYIDGLAANDFSKKVGQTKMINNEPLEQDKSHLKHKLHNFQAKLLGSGKKNLLNAVCALAADFGASDTPAETLDMIEEMDKIILDREKVEDLDGTLYKNMSLKVFSHKNQLEIDPVEDQSPDIIELNGLESMIPMPDYSTGILSNDFQDKKRIREEKNEQITSTKNQITMLELGRRVDPLGKTEWINEEEKKKFHALKDSLEKLVQKLTDEVKTLDTHIDQAEKMRKIVNPRFVVPEQAAARTKSKIDNTVIATIMTMNKVGSASNPTFSQVWQRLLDFGEIYQFTVKDYKDLLPFLFEENSPLSAFVHSIKQLPLEEMLDQIKQRTGEILPSLNTKLQEYTDFKKSPNESYQAAYLRAQNLATYITSSMYVTDEERKMAFDNRMETLLEKCLTPDQQRQMHHARSMLTIYGKHNTSAIDLWQQAIQLFSNRAPMRTIIHSLQSQVAEDDNCPKQVLDHKVQSETDCHTPVDDSDSFQNEALSKLNSIIANTTCQTRNNNGKSILNKTIPHTRPRPPMPRQEASRDEAKRATWQEPMITDSSPQKPILNPPRFNPDEHANSNVFPPGVLKGPRQQFSGNPQTASSTQPQGQFGKQTWPPQQYAPKQYPPQQTSKPQFQPNGSRGFNPKKARPQRTQQPSEPMRQNSDWNPIFMPNNRQRRQFGDFQSQQLGYQQTNDRGFTQQGECFTCGDPSHWANRCPHKQDRGNRGSFNQTRGGFSGGNGSYRNNGNNSYANNKSNFPNGRRNGKIVQATYSTNGDEATMFKAVINQPCQICGPNVEPHRPNDCYRVTPRFRRLEKQYKRNYIRDQNRQQSNQTFLENGW